MTHELFSQFSNAGHASYESLRELGEINARAIKRLTEIQLALANLGIDGTVRQTRLLTTTSSYSDLVAAQSRMASEYGGRLLEISREAAEGLSESREAFVAWAKRSFEKTPGTVNKPAGKSKPKTAVRRGTSRKAA